MPGLSDGIFTTGDNIAATNPNHIGKFVGLGKHFGTRQRWIDACASVITAQWTDGEPMTIADEATVPVKHIWFKSLTHARTVEISGLYRHVFPSTANRVWATTGLPSAAIGTNDDLALDQDAGLLYIKVTGQWELLKAIGGGGGAALPPAPATINAPAITGNPLAGSTLQVSNGTWTKDPVAFRYQWYSKTGTDPIAAIAGETNATYASKQTDIGKIITASVAASNGRYSEAVFANNIEVVPAPPTPTTGNPSITGTPKVGNLLTAASAGGWANNTGISYEWTRDGTAIPGATDAATYAVVLADQGKVIGLNTRGKNAGGKSATALTAVPTAAVAAPDAQPTGTDIPLTTQLFDNYVANRLPTVAYAFGSEATALPALQTSHVINSLESITKAFSPHNDFTKDTKINAEAQTYVSVPNKDTHRVGTDRLGLWANLQPGEEWYAPADGQVNSSLPSYVNGTATPWANLPATAGLGFADTMMTAEVGQFVAFINKGMCMISSITPGSSVTFTPLFVKNTSNQVNQMMSLLPIHSAICTGYTSGTNTMQFAPNSLSTKVKPGYSIAKVNTSDGNVLQMATDIYVTSVDRATGVVRLNKSIPIAMTNVRTAFYPRIAAGQIWTKDLYNIRPSGSLLALEWDVNIFPGFSQAADADLPRTGSRWDLNSTLTKYPDIPAGGWPALWFYSGDDGSAGSNGTSEGDPMELFMSCTMGARLFSTGNVAPGGSASLFDRTDQGWTKTTDGKNRMSPATDGFSMAGRHKIQYVLGWEPTDPLLPADPTTNPLRSVSVHMLDGVVIHKETFRWQSARPAQLGMNMAMGWMSENGASNFQFPFRTSNFQKAGMELLSLKVWSRVGPAA